MKKDKIIICPGSINPDFIIRSEKPLKLSNRSITFSGQSSVYAGGKGRNQAVSAKRSSGKNTEVVLVGCVGKDIFGKQAVDNLKKEKIKTDYIFQTDKAQTGKCILSVFKGGYQIVGLDLGANRFLNLENIKLAEKEIAQAKVLVAQIENTKEATRESLKLAKKHNCFTILNPSLVPSDPSYVTKKMFPYVDLLVANVQEAGQLLGKELKNKKDYVAAAKEFGKQGIKYVTITLAEKGSLIYFQNKWEFISALKVKEVDTTACGDIFVGALASQFLDSMGNFEKFIQAVKFATVAAGLAITKIGASESAPTRTEVMKKIKFLDKQ